MRKYISLLLGTVIIMSMLNTIILADSGASTSQPAIVQVNFDGDAAHSIGPLGTDIYRVGDTIYFSAIDTGVSFDMTKHLRINWSSNYPNDLIINGVESPASASLVLTDEMLATGLHVTAQSSLINRVPVSTSGDMRMIVSNLSGSSVNCVGDLLNFSVILSPLDDPSTINWHVNMGTIIELGNGSISVLLTEDMVGTGLVVSAECSQYQSVPIRTFAYGGAGAAVREILGGGVSWVPNQVGTTKRFEAIPGQGDDPDSLVWSVNLGAIIPNGDGTISVLLTDDMVESGLAVTASFGYEHFATVNLTTNAASYSLTNQDGSITGPGPYDPGDIVTITVDRFMTSGDRMDDIVWTGATPTGDNANTATIAIPSDLNTNVTYTPSATLYAILAVEETLEGDDNRYITYHPAEYGTLFNQPVNQYDGYGGVEWIFDGTFHPILGHIRFNLLNLLDEQGDPIVIDGPHNFHVYHYKIHTITASTNGVGSVSPMTSSLCRYEFLTLTAVNNEHGTFSHWLKDGAPIDFTNAYFRETATANGSELKVLNHDGDAHYTAVFTPVIYNVTVSVDPDSNAGTATVTPASGSNAENFTLLATANPGYDFVQWLDTSLLPITSGDNRTLTFPFEMDTNYTAEFSMRSQHHIATVVQNNNGTGVGNTATISLDTTTGIEVTAASGDYTVGSELTLTASSSSDYGFMGWLLNGETISTNPTTTVTVSDSDARYTAVFELGYYNVTASPNVASRGSVTVTGSPVLSGNEVTLVASHNTGNFFKKYIDANTGITLGYSSRLTLVPSGDMAIIAVFDSNPSNDDPYQPGPNPNPDEDDDISGTDAEEGTSNMDADDGLDNNLDDQEATDDDLIGGDALPAANPAAEDVEQPDNDEVTGPDEVTITGEVNEDILNGNVPEGIPTMPQTGGLPLGLLFFIGSYITSLGITIKKSKK